MIYLIIAGIFSVSIVVWGVWDQMKHQRKLLAQNTTYSLSCLTVTKQVCVFRDHPWEPKLEGYHRCPKNWFSTDELKHKNG